MLPGCVSQTGNATSKGSHILLVIKVTPPTPLWKVRGWRQFSASWHSHPRQMLWLGKQLLTLIFAVSVVSRTMSARSERTTLEAKLYTSSFSLHAFLATWRVIGDSPSCGNYSAEANCWHCSRAPSCSSKSWQVLALLFQGREMALPLPCQGSDSLSDSYLVFGGMLILSAGSAEKPGGWQWPTKGQWE